MRSSGLRAIAEDTAAAVARGGYDPGAGAPVSIGVAAAAAVAGTDLYLPSDPLPALAPPATAPVVEVTGESSLVAAGRPGAARDDLVCLVFASTHTPGGGVLNGAEAQEESIARASVLYARLTAAPDFCAHHRADADLCYSDRVIYSPRVPVFRDDDGALLATPYLVSFRHRTQVTAIRREQSHRAAAMRAAMHRRAVRVLLVAAAHGHRRLVLGTWNCGVFGNDRSRVAGGFAAGLREVPAFAHVTFGIRHRDPRSPGCHAFADTLVAPR